MGRPPTCKLPKRKLTDYVILGVGILASVLTVAGKFGLFTTTLVSTPAVMTNQDIFTMFLGVIIFILVVMLWRRSRK